MRISHFTITLIISAILTGLAQQPLQLGWLAWFSLVPFIFILNRIDSKKAYFKAGFIWGFVYYLTVIFWLAMNIGTTPLIGMISMLAAVLYCSLNIAVISLIMGFLKSYYSQRWFWLMPLVWTSVEYIRNMDVLTGGPWTSLANTQLDFHTLVQNAEISGIYGITFWIILLNVCIYNWIDRPGSKHLFTVVAIFIIPWTTGLYLTPNPQTYSKNKIDIAASQIMIEALVIEINSEELENLGINLSGQGENFTVTTPNTTSVDGIDVVTGLAIEYSDAGLTELIGEEDVILESMFTANIQAILNSSTGEILSKPSVMVMDGRQARIQIGQHIPITRTTPGTSYTSEDIEYIPTGIILNIRPRISTNSNEILMQVETIITNPENLSYTSDGILITPIINNRKVETFIRIENNNPFIIGGLISDKKYDNTKRWFRSAP